LVTRLRALNCFNIYIIKQLKENGIINFLLYITPTKKKNETKMYYTFLHFKRRFLYNEKYIKIIYCITLMNNEELIKENLALKNEIETLKEKLYNNYYSYISFMDPE